MKQIATSIATALLGLLALTALPAAASLPPDQETSYGYLRTVEGPGRVVQAASGAPIDIEANYPVLAGENRRHVAKWLKSHLNPNSLAIKAQRFASFLALQTSAP